MLVKLEVTRVQDKLGGPTRSSDIYERWAEVETLKKMPKLRVGELRQR